MDSGYDAATATSGASVFSGGLWNALSRVLPQIYVVVQSAVAARYLGVEGMGRQSFISFVMLSTTMLFGLGLNGALVRYFSELLGSRQPEAARGLVGWVWRIELVASLVAGGILAVVAFVGPDLQTAWLLAAAATALGVLNSVPYAVLAGSQRWREVSVASVVIGFVGTATTIAVLAAGGGIAGIFVVQVLVTAASLAWTKVLADRALETVAPRAGPFADLRKPMVKFAAVNWLGFALSLIVWRRSEYFFLKRYSSDVQIGLYSVAFAAVAGLVATLEAISVVIAPAVATLSGAGAQERLRAGFSRALRLLLMLSLPLTAGALAVGPAALRLVYGVKYDGAVVPLLIMLAVFPVLPLMNASSALLWGLGRVGTWLAICSVASVANLTLDLALIPRHGAIGAALANSGAQVTASLAILALACRHVGPVTWHVRSLLRCTAAAVGAGLAATAVLASLGGVLGVACAVAAGTSAFGALAMTLRILPATDADWLNDVVGRHIGGLLGRACLACSDGRSPSSQVLHPDR